MAEIRDNRELMRNRTDREVCRSCGSVKVHTQNYGSPKPECVAYLRRKLADAELQIRKLSSEVV